MAVPKTGKFDMFGTGSIFSIEGAVSSSITDYNSNDTDRFSGSAHLIGQSVTSKFDTDEIPGQAFTNNVNISESIQYRGYPLVNNYSMTLKCVYTSSFKISGSTPPPPADSSFMCFERISGSPFFNSDKNGWIPSNSNITGSGGFGDTSWPVSSSYGYYELSHKDRKIKLSVNLNGLSQTPPTFTSLTVSSPGKTDLVLDYCDLASSSSLGDIYTYFWDSSDPQNHFTSGNCITASYDTTAVDYYIDCDPAISTTPVTITIGNVAASKQQSCDATTTSTVYMTPTDLTNGLTVGDYVYETSDGRSPFNGQSKFWGINTSSAPSLNSVPDKIVQIVSNGLITAISDCVVTPPYEPPLDPASRDCNSTDANPTGIIINETAYLGAGEYNVHQIGESSESTQAFLWVSYDRPNKFTLYDDSSTFANPIYSTGWVGKATYNNAAGKDQWSTPLDTNTSGSQLITWGSTTGRKVRVDYGSSPNTFDSSVFSLVCTSSLQPLNLFTGSSGANACREDSYSDVHYHFHTTGSGEFSDISTVHRNNNFGIQKVGRVFEDNTGLNPVLSENAKYFAYTSSEGTRYVYSVLDNQYVNGYINYNMGSIANHQQCPGDPITSIRLMAASTDCDDSNTPAFVNHLYVGYLWAGLDIVNGKFKIDNDGLTLSNQQEIDLYNNDPSDSVISPYSLDSSTETVSETAESNTFLVSDDSLKNPTGTKVLATVTAGTPATVSFTPCTAVANGCTEFAASSYFESSDFAGSDPTGYKCALDTPDQIWISMAGNEPAVGDGVYSTDDCSSYIDESDVYFTIYNDILGSTYNILMDSAGEEIASIWSCSAAQVGNSGTDTYYISTGYSDMGDHCGGSVTAISTEVTIDAANTSVAVNNIVYKDGARFNGGGKFYIVSDSSTSTTGLGGDSYKFWKISSTGIVTQVNDFTCPVEVLTTTVEGGSVVSLTSVGDIEYYEIEFESFGTFKAVYADDITRTDFPAGATFEWIPELGYDDLTEEPGFPNTGRTKRFNVENCCDSGFVTIQMTVGGVVRAIGQMFVYSVDDDI